MKRQRLKTRAQRKREDDVKGYVIIACSLIGFAIWTRVFYGWHWL